MIIAQISDTHISLASAATTPNNDTAIHLERAVDHLMRMPTLPDLVIVTGDCVNTGQAAEYARFRELISPLTMPVYVIPGNHDDRGLLLKAFGPQGAKPLAGFVQYVVEGWPVRLIGLDTNLPGHDEGNLCAQRLEWLEQRLAEAPNQPTMLFMHHPPFKTGLAVTDSMGLLSAGAFGALVARHPQVERIVAGHIHMALAQRFGGTLAMTCAAIGHTMLPDFQRPQLLSVLMEPAACLLHVWNDTAGLASYTSLIGDHGPMVDLHDGTRWL